MTAREWLEIVAVVLAWTSPVWVPALAVTADRPLLEATA